MDKEEVETQDSPTTIEGPRILYNLFVHENEWVVNEQEEIRNALPEPLYLYDKSENHSENGDVLRLPDRSTSKVGRVISAVSGVLSSVGRILRPIVSKIPESYRQFKMNTMPWNVKLSPSGSCLAVSGCNSSVNESHISFRFSKDDFSTDSVVWKGQLDPLPQWRCGVWTAFDDGSEVFAASTSQSEVVVIASTGEILLSLGPDNLASPIRHGVAGLALFWDVKAVSLVLAIVDYGCSIFRIFVPKDPNTTPHKISTEPPLDVSKYHNGCITSSTFDSDSNLLVLAGIEHDFPAEKIDGKDGPGKYTDSLRSTSDGIDIDTSNSYSLSLWRAINTPPYWSRLYCSNRYRLVRDPSSDHGTDSSTLVTEESDDIAAMPTRRVQSVWNSVTGLITGKSPKRMQVVVSCILSPSNSLIALLLVSGAVHVWNIQSKCAVNELLPEEDDKVTSIGWWSDSALIVSRGNGSVAILTLPDWKNILGSSPELVQPGALVTSAHAAGHFFILEHESWHEGDREMTEPAKVEQDEDDSAVWKQAARRIDKVFYLWTPGGDLDESDLDSDSDWPPKSIEERKRASVYRLLSLSETTPHALFQSKVELSDYDGALKLGKAFGLDTDAVYEAQWQSTDVSSDTINNYLKNVKSKLWVINQCITRVSAEAVSMRLLLEFGLSVTTLDRLENLDSNTDFSSIRSMIRQDMTDEERERIKERITILRYLDRLAIFLKIHRGVYEPESYTDFRDMDLIEDAVSAAVSEDFETLEVLLSVPGVAVFPARFAILSCVPETAFVDGYAQLLPIATENGDEKLLDRQAERDEDWTDDVQFVYEVYKGTKVTADGALVTMSLPNHLTTTTAASKEALGGFYRQRAREMDRRAGMVDNALALLNHGISVGVRGLEDLRNDVVELCRLVYEHGVVAATLDEYEQMSQLEKVGLFLDGVNDADVGDAFKSRLLPLLVNRTNVDISDLIMDYLMQKASEGQMERVAKMIELGRSDLFESKQTIFSDFSELVTCSLNAVYSCSNGDNTTLIMMQRISDCLPKPKQFDNENSENTVSEDPVINDCVSQEQQEKICTFEKHLAASVLLGNYEIEIPVKHFVGINAVAARSLIESIVKVIAKQSRRPAGDNLWKALLTDIRKLQGTVLGCLPMSTCFEVYLRHMLSAGRFSYASEVLRSKELFDSPDSIREVVLHASREYFNAAADPDDLSMKSALSCMTVLVPGDEGVDHPDVVSERNLVDAVAALREHGTDLLPVQIRLERNKLNVIAAALKTSSNLYKDPDGAVTISKLLGLQSSDDEISVRVLAAEAACDREDFKCAFKVCESLICREGGASSAWTVWKCLSTREEVDPELRQKCASLALLYGPESEQMNLLESWRSLKNSVCRTNVKSPWISTSGFYGANDLFSWVSDSRSDTRIIQKLDAGAAEIGELLSDRNVDQSGPALRVRWRKTLTEFTKAAFHARDSGLIVASLCTLWDDSSDAHVKSVIEDWINSLEGSRTKALASLLGAYAVTLGHANDYDLRLAALRCVPLDLIRLVVKVASLDNASMAQDMDTISPWHSELSSTSDLISNLIENVREAQHTQALEVLHSTVDAKKFSVNSEYRQSVLESLPRRTGHGQVQGLLTAIKLARRVGVEAWQIAVSHFVWYISERETATSEESEEEVDDQTDIVATIRSRVALPSVKEALEDGGLEAAIALKNATYPKLIGSNYDQLTALFTCMLACLGRILHRRGRNNLRKKTEFLQKTLQKALDLINGLNCKLIIDAKFLLDGSIDMSRRLNNFISSENVQILATLAVFIPNDNILFTESDLDEEKSFDILTDKSTCPEDIFKVYCFKGLGHICSTVDTESHDELVNGKLTVWHEIAARVPAMRSIDVDEFVCKIMEWALSGAHEITLDTAAVVLGDISTMLSKEPQKEPMGLTKFSMDMSVLLKLVSSVVHETERLLLDSGWLQFRHCIDYAYTLYRHGKIPPFSQGGNAPWISAAYYYWCSCLPYPLLETSTKIVQLMEKLNPAGVVDLPTVSVHTFDLGTQTLQYLLGLLAIEECDTMTTKLVLTERGSANVVWPPKTFSEIALCLKALLMTAANECNILSRLLRDMTEFANPDCASTPASARVATLAMLKYLCVHDADAESDWPEIRRDCWNLAEWTEEHEKWLLYAKSVKLVSDANIPVQIEWQEFSNFKTIFTSCLDNTSKVEQYETLAQLLELWASSRTIIANFDQLEGDCWERLISGGLEVEPGCYDYIAWWNRSNMLEEGERNTLVKFEKLLGPQARVECGIISQFRSIREEVPSLLVDFESNHTVFVFDRPFYEAMAEIPSSPLLLVDTPYFNELASVMCSGGASGVSKFSPILFRYAVLSLYESGHISDAADLVAWRYLEKAPRTICWKDVQKLLEKVLLVARNESVL